jgi:general secretion pathway protein E
MENLLQYDVDYGLIKNLDRSLLQKHNILPIAKNILYTLVATSNSSQDIDSLIKLFQTAVKLITVDKKQIDFEFEYLDIKLKLFELSIKAMDSTNINSENSYIIEFIDIIFKFCITNNVSDIHFESLEKSMIIRFRIDGELTQFFRFEKKLYDAISSIIKIFGNLDIAQKRLPLNARFSREINTISYDFRISTMPTIYGESIVLRILDNGNIKKDLLQIGFKDKILKTIKRNIQLNQGLILVTGPTGSGKSTTLYSILNALNSKQKKIITIEDPVEYKLDGVMQINIDEQIDLNYHRVLKNILRQDPDILMIGEIRDKESLQIAMQASLTGHLVIATLHTNNSLETLTRLKDLEAQPYLISSTLKMVLSQRLLRILCSYCKQKDSRGDYKHVGCKECNFIGYKGRTVVSEILQIDEKIAKMISKNKELSMIKKYLENKQFQTLAQNSKILVQNGITTLDEHYSKV